MEMGRGGKWEGEHLGSGGRVQVRAPGALTRMGRSKLLSSTGQCWETSRNLGGGAGSWLRGGTQKCRYWNKIKHYSSINLPKIYTDWASALCQGLCEALGLEQWKV